MSRPYKPSPGIPASFGAEFQRIIRKKLVSLSANANTGMRSILDIPGRPEDNFTICAWVRIGTQASNTLWASQNGHAQLYNGTTGSARYSMRGRHYNNKAADSIEFGEMVWGHIVYQHGLNFQSTIDVKMFSNGDFTNSHTGGSASTDITTDGFHWFLGDDATTTTDDGFIGEMFDFCFMDGIIPPGELNYSNGKWVDLTEFAKSKCVYRLDGQTSEPGHDSSGGNNHFQVENGGVTLSLDDLPPGANVLEVFPVSYLPAPAAGGADITGTGAIDTTTPTLSGTGERTVTGTGTPLIAIATLSGTGKITVTGSGAINSTLPALSGTAEVVKTGTGAIDTPVTTLSGTGAVVFTGTGSISATVATLSGTGKITVTGSGTPSIPVTTLSGTGKITKTGTGAINTTLPAIAGTGTVGDVVTGSGAIDTTVATLAGTGVITVTGSGAITAQMPALSGTGAIGRTGSGAIETPAANLSGTGNVATTVTGTGAIETSLPTLSGSSPVVDTGFGGGWWQWVPKKKKKERKPEPEIFEEIKEAIAEAPAGPDKKAAAADLRALRRAITSAVVTDYQRQLGELAESLALLDSLLAEELRRAFLQRRQNQWDEDAAILLLMAV